MHTITPVRFALAGAGAIALTALGLGAIPAAAADSAPGHPTAIISQQSDGSTSGTLDDLGGARFNLNTSSDFVCPDGYRTGFGVYIAPPIQSAADFVLPSATDGSSPYITVTSTSGGFIDTSTGTPTSGKPNPNIPVRTDSPALSAPAGDTWTPPNGVLSDFWEVRDPGLSEPLNPGDYSLVFTCGNSGGPADHSNVAWSTLHFNSDGSWTDSAAAPAAPAVGTSTTLAAAVDGTTSTTANLTATVAAASGSTKPTGTVNFYEDGSSTAANPSPVNVDGNGVATFAATGLAGSTGGTSHSFVAKFTPSDASAFSASQSASQSVTITTPKPATSVTVTGSVVGTELTLTATVSSGGATAQDAAGTVTFTQSGGSINDSGKTLTHGVATDVIDGVDPEASYVFTATYHATADENYADSPASSSTTVQPPAPTADGSVTGTTGDLVPGSTYTVAFPDGTFPDGDTLSVTLHSAAQALAGTTATPTGAVSYQLTIPAGTPSGSHTVVFASTTTPTAATHAVSISVAAAPTATNTPAAFMTDWVKRTVATPTGAATLGGGAFVIVISLLGGLVAGGVVLWSLRRRQREDVVRD